MNGILQDLKKTSLEIIHSNNAQDASMEGLLLTALSSNLGAPFWFNTLRGLSNLRPANAQLLNPKTAASQKQAA
jgi:hypothetical protein